MKKLKRVLLGIGIALAVALVALLCVPVPTKALAAGDVHSVRLLDCHGLLLREVLSSEQGTSAWSPFDAISPDLVAATLVAEDRRFWSHPGVDLVGLGRAISQNVRHRQVVSGASTIAMQLVSNAYGHPAPTVGYKLWQAASALRLLTVASHREVLERYLNTVPYGHQTFGVQAAARFYFDRAASRLSLAQAAYLAALPCSPSWFDPLSHPERVKERQEWILREMSRLGKASPDRVLLALQEDVKLDLAATRFLAPHFCDMAMQRLGGRSGDVHTTLDLSLQKDLEGMLRSHLRTVQQKGATNGAIVVLDNPTGAVRAFVGSADFATSQVDGALALRQPGSTLKPFTYSLALERRYTAASLLADLPARYRNGNVDYVPVNYDGIYHGPVRLRTALACSYNAPAVAMLAEIGTDVLLSRLHDLGFDSLKHDPGYYGLGLTLGGGEVTLLELARAYRTLAQGGLYTPERIFGDEPASPHRVMSDRVAYVLTDILADANAREPAFGPHSVLNMPFPCAVKTGTSHDFTDNWTVGYTTRYTTAIWVGDFNAHPMRQVSGVTGAGGLFRSVMLRLHQDAVPVAFPRPYGLVEMDVCPDSGELPGPYCTSHVREVFIQAYAPTGTCHVHQMVDGKRETVFPARYQEWMHEVGLSLPHRALDADQPGIVEPADGDVFHLDPVLRRDYQSVRLSVVPPGGVREVSWFVDGKPFLKVGPPFSGQWELSPGDHQIQARGGTWTSDAVHVAVR